MSRALSQVSPTQFIHPLRDKSEWPELSMMRMPAQLQVHTVLHRFFEMSWLMIHHDDRQRTIDIDQELIQRRAFFLSELGDRSVFSADENTRILYRHRLI